MRVLIQLLDDRSNVVASVTSPVSDRLGYGLLRHVAHETLVLPEPPELDQKTLDALAERAREVFGPLPGEA